MSWYQGKIFYIQEQENGTLKTVNELYLIDAVSFTDAEIRLTTIMEEHGTPNHAVKAIVPKKFTDIFTLDEVTESTKWWQGKIAFTYEKDNGNETKSVSFVLVQADGLQKAIDRLILEFKNYLIPYEIEALAVTSILEVHPYTAPEEKAGAADNEQ